MTYSFFNPHKQRNFQFFVERVKALIRTDWLKRFTDKQIIVSASQNLVGEGHKRLDDKGRRALNNRLEPHL